MNQIILACLDCLYQILIIWSMEKERAAFSRRRVSAQKLQILCKQILKGVHSNWLNEVQDRDSVHLSYLVKNQRSVFVKLAIIVLLVEKQRNADLMKVFEIHFGNQFKFLGLNEFYCLANSFKKCDDEVKVGAVEIHLWVNRVSLRSKILRG